MKNKVYKDNDLSTKTSKENKRKELAEAAINCFREELKDLKPYQAADENYGIKLHANESPMDIPLKIREKLADELIKGTSLNRYPDSDANVLRQKIADLYNLNRDNILVGAGSDELIQVIISAFVGHGDIVLCPYPSFGMYKIFTSIAGGIPLEFSLGNSFEYNTDEILALSEKHKAKLLFLCSPNNPTGNTIPIEEICSIAENFPGIVVVDEAYGEFSGESVIPCINDYPNIIVLRTFSKALGLAGLRIGYSVCSRELADKIYIVKPPYNINSFSQRAASLILENYEIIKKQYEQIVESRDKLYNALKRMDGLTVYPSKANFILISMDNSEYVYNALLKNDILVRSYTGHPVLGTSLRVTVGSHEENLKFLECLKDILV